MSVLRAKLGGPALAALAVVACNGASAPPDVPMAAADASPPPALSANVADDSREAEAESTTPTSEPAETARAPGSAQFDRAAAANILGSVEIRSCAAPGGPTGSGHVTISFSPSGRVAAAAIDGGRFPGTTVGACIATRFRSARVPAFTGAVVKVGKSFTLP